MISVIGTRYAEAIFQVGEERNNTDELYQELKEVFGIIASNEELFSVMKSPLIGKEEKKNLIENIFKGRISSELNNFLKIIIDKDRISALKEIENAFYELLKEKNNILEGVVISAVSMEASELKSLEEKLSQKYNKTVILVNEVDTTILGGVLVRLGNEEIDGTVRTRLNKMKDTLSQVIS